MEIQSTPSGSLLSRRAQAMRASEIRELLKLIDQPGMISFAGGIPDPALFDRAAYLRAYERALVDDAACGRALQYSASEGHLPLREWVAGHMAERGVTCGPEHILITHGSQQALDLIGKLTLDPQDLVLTRRPTYLGAIQSLSAFEPVFGSWPNHASGRAKLLYLVPDFANPDGATLSLQERLDALALAERDDTLVVEDGAYASLRYEGEDVAPIAALDQRRNGGIERSRTLYCGTFSKTLSPGLRVGWVCGPQHWIRRLTLAKQAADLHTATINQIVAHQVAAADFAAQVSRACNAYRQRRDRMLEALARHAVPGVSWTRPEGGLFVWLTLPAGMDAAQLLARTLAEQVAFVPGQAFHPDGCGRDTLRLSFSLADARQTDTGIARLMRAIAQAPQTAAARQAA